MKVRTLVFGFIEIAVTDGSVRNLIEELYNYI
jgi:hypothetical protein